MGISEAVREVLAADATLAGMLVGGIYSYAQIGRNGISRVTTPEAYTAGGFLQPCAVVKADEAEAAAAIRDSAAGSRQMFEVFLYDDGDNEYAAITAARVRAVELLDRQWLGGVGYVRRVGGEDEGRDPKLNNAALVRVTFEMVS